MIAKISASQNFRGLFRYLLSPKKVTRENAHVLTTNTEARCDPEALADEYTEAARTLRPDLSQPCIHVSVRLASEDLAPLAVRDGVDAVFKATAARIVEAFGPAAHTVVRHGDDHMHMVMLGITLRNDRMDRTQEKRRLERIMRKMERAFSLRTLESSWEGESRRAVNANTRQGARSLKHGIADGIDMALGGAPDLATFRHRLADLGIDVAERTNPDGRITGLSFTIVKRDTGERFHFAGSRIGKSYALGSLRKRGLTIPGDPKPYPPPSRPEPAFDWTTTAETYLRKTQGWRGGSTIARSKMDPVAIGDPLGSGPLTRTILPDRTTIILSEPVAADLRAFEAKIEAALRAGHQPRGKTAARFLWDIGAPALARRILKAVMGEANPRFMRRLGIRTATHPSTSDTWRPFGEHETARERVMREALVHFAEHCPDPTQSDRDYVAVVGETATRLRQAGLDRPEVLMTSALRAIDPKRFRRARNFELNTVRQHYARMARSDRFWDHELRRVLSETWIPLFPDGIDRIRQDTIRDAGRHLIRDGLQVDRQPGAPIDLERANKGAGALDTKARVLQRHHPNNRHIGVVALMGEVKKGTPEHYRAVEALQANAANQVIQAWEDGGLPAAFDMLRRQETFLRTVEAAPPRTGQAMNHPFRHYAATYLDAHGRKAMAAFLDALQAHKDGTLTPTQRFNLLEDIEDCGEDIIDPRVPNRKRADALLHALRLGEKAGLPADQAVATMARGFPEKQSRLDAFIREACVIGDGIPDAAYSELCRRLEGYRPAQLRAPRSRHASRQTGAERER